jgi:hypothetical protein
MNHRSPVLLTCGNQNNVTVSTGGRLRVVETGGGISCRAGPALARGYRVLQGRHLLYRAWDTMAMTSGQRRRLVLVRHAEAAGPGVPVALCPPCGSEGGLCFRRAVEAPAGLSAGASTVSGRG